MTTREQFQAELEELKELTIKMANLAGKALNKSIEALFTQNTALAEEVLQEDKAIDQLEADINEKTVLLIAKQQPVATDLRQVIITLRIVTDIERMGDNAKNIAKSAISLGDNMSTIPEGLKEMNQVTQEMLSSSMQAFNYQDITIAANLASTDDKVDKLYKTIVSELLGETANNPDRIQYIMQVAFCARYIERFADHITNIGESILYLVKGKNYKMN
ncbi:phosphate signaling complex protein PhoU [Oceanobacillus sp. CAU 1775]